MKGRFRDVALVFDCKLRFAEEEGSEVEGITSQIRQAAHTARRLGGLGAEVVLLRPNREVSGPFRALADDLRVRIIDKTDRGCFFRKLAEFVRCRELPESLRQMDELFADPKNALLVFPATPMLRAAADAAEDHVITLETLCGTWLHENGQDWTVVRLRLSRHYLQYANRRGLAKPLLKEAVRSVLERFGTISQMEVSGKGFTLYAFFTVPEDEDKVFRTFLASRTGKPLVE